jgi:3-methyladenine DNA glycosylase AlkD
MLNQINQNLVALGNESEAQSAQRFFKTGPGEYGEGDQFRGIRVPVLRQLAREYKSASVEDATALLQSRWHEDRLLALFLWIGIFKRQAKQREAIYNLYLANTNCINNWDLVDSSASHIIGAWLWDKERAQLYALARSQDLWERRIAMLATFHFIQKRDFEDALRLAEILRDDRHDLMHKAVGWMLREIGKRDSENLQNFLNKHHQQMPRTMLRYAIEKLPEATRQSYLKRQRKVER